MRIDWNELTDPLGESLKTAIRDVVADATDAELTEFTVGVAARTIDILMVDDEDRKWALMAEHRATLANIAEVHRINLAEVARERMVFALDVGVSFIVCLVAAAV
tara:strand:- start:1601 stop:1915 length:315 start_codon:yes stop_codon:yes gene_type:complete